MQGIKRLLAVILCALTLFGCAEKPISKVTQPRDFSVKVETFGTEEVTSAITEETLSADITAVSTTKTSSPESEREYKTDDIKSKSEYVSASSIGEAQEYMISPASGTMKATSSVNVRSLPDADSNRIGHLDKGETVEFTGLCSNGWVKIIYKGGEGYVNGKYLTEASSSETSVETKLATTTSAETKMTTLPPETTTATTTETPATSTILETTAEPEETEDVSESGITDVIISPNSYHAINYDVQKAVWIAYLDIDQMIKGASEQQFRSKISAEYDNIVSLGCNTVYVHVRSFGDAYYYSAIYPFTAAYSDTIGVAPPYDPLKIMIDEAHSRGLSFHAWVNPMRTTSKENFANMNSSYVLKQWYDSNTANGTFLVYDSSTKFWWLSPAYPAVRALICSGISEIVSNYNVDGIHIDDYFYPTTSSSFDMAAFEASGWSDRAAWRRSVVSSLVREIYSTVKACNSTVLFGVSPQGNIENNYDNLYADVKMWCSTAGYLDYIVPQIYYGFNDSLSYDTAARQWMSIRTSGGVKLVIGIGAYKVGVNTEWSGGEILKSETDYAKSIGADGVAYYRSGSLFGSASSSEKLMQKELPGLIRSIKDF